MSTFISINIARLFLPANPQNYNCDKIMQKREIIFVNLPNTSYFMHFQSVRQKKWNIHNKTNEYRWHFRSKPHQTTSLKQNASTEVDRMTWLHVPSGTYCQIVVILTKWLNLKRDICLDHFETRLNYRCGPLARSDIEPSSVILGQTKLKLWNVTTP